MTLSEDTCAALEYFDSSIEGGLRKRNDVGTILELAATYGHADLFNELVRTGTATWKVYSTLKRLNKGDEGFSKLEEEFSLQMNQLREQLATLSTNADDETLKRFDDVYFGMTSGVIRNIVDLGHDLAKIKSLRGSS